MKSNFIAALLGLSSLAAGAQAPRPALTTIESLDVPRYMGAWYEIAMFPNAFQKKCVGDYWVIDLDAKMQLVAVSCTNAR